MGALPPTRGTRAFFSLSCEAEAFGDGARANVRHPPSTSFLRLGATALLSFAVSFALMRAGAGADEAAATGTGGNGDESADAGGGDDGPATLDILFDGPDLFIDLDVPATTLLGFAHAPTNRAEHEVMVDAFHRLDTGDLIVTTPAAQCSLTGSFATVGHGYDDLCSNASAHALDSADGVDRGWRDGWHGADAAIAVGPRPDVAARWSWSCTAPEELRTLEVKLFEAFDRLGSIDVRLGLVDTERTLELVPYRRSIDL